LSFGELKEVKEVAMKFKREIQIFWQMGVSSKQIEFVKWAILLFLRHVRVEDKIEVTFGQSFRLSKYKQKRPSEWKGFMDADKIFEFLKNKQKIDGNKYYSVLLVHNKIFFNQDGERSEIAGLGQSDAVAIVHVDQPKKIDTYYTRAYIVGVLMHELGHIFHLINESRTYNVTLYKGCKHCSRKTCVMYPIVISTGLDLEKTPFCFSCLFELRNFFIEND